jgi:hypothetical protein
VFSLLEVVLLFPLQRISDHLLSFTNCDDISDFKIGPKKSMGKDKVEPKIKLKHIPLFQHTDDCQIPWQAFCQPPLRNLKLFYSALTFFWF